MASAVSLTTLWGLSTAALAAADAVDEAAPDLLNLPWPHIAVAVAISLAAGLTATMGRELRAQYDGTAFRRAHEYRKDAGVSVLLGLGCYVLAWSLGASRAETALAIIVGGYGGARSLTVAVDRALDMLRRGSREGTQ